MPADHPSNAQAAARTAAHPVRLPAARRRDQLLEVALALFGRRGYHATSMDDIAEAAGVTKPVLYQHFRSKKGLYLELIDAVGADLAEEVSASATAEEDRQRRLLAGFRAYFRFVAERTDAFRLLFGSGARIEADTEAIGRVERRLSAAIAELIEADIDAGHRELLATAIVGAAEVTSRRWVTAVDTAVSPTERGDTDDLRGGGLSCGGPSCGALSDGDLLAQRLSDMVWAGLRSLPGARDDPGWQEPRAQEPRRQEPGG